MTSAVRCYPNPVTGTLTVEMPALKMHSVRLYNAAGSLLTQWNEVSEGLEVDFAGLASGNYYLAFQGETEGFVRKLVKI